MAISGEAVNGSHNNNGQEEEEDEKPRTLFVGNVPREVHKREIEEVFGDIGPLKRCYIQYPRVGNEKRKQREDTTVAYVTFALSQDATRALETLQSTKIGSNKINIKFAKARSEQVRPSFGDGYRGRNPRNANFEPVGGVVPKPKEPRPKIIKKKARLIVRNLSFKVTEEKMKEYFAKFGVVKEVNILKKGNGKLVGCAFIQYQNIYEASTAIKELNMKDFLGRPIAIDWALPKAKYQTDEEKQQKKDDAGGDDTIEIKDEPESEGEEAGQNNVTDHYEHLKEESMDSEDITEVKIEEGKRKFEDKKSRKRKSKASDSEDEETDDEDDIDRVKIKREGQRKKQKILSNDVEEGKTLFLRNLSFDTKQDDLKQFFETFGELHYALICKDSLTEHPKGTGFVKFKTKASADNCLQRYANDSDDFKLSGRQFNVSVAISKEQIQNKSSEKEEKKTEMKPKADGRNLYLVREGFIRPGSAAATDVSLSDMNKRASLNKVKKQMLKNLNILISPTRICIHNLPVKFSDTKLRSLFKKHAGQGAKITEARIMRDMKDIGLDGKGKSKGFGFVNFADHEHALTALRSINNNPSVFNSNNRPIVEFSMENRLALRAKEKRALKSKEKNPQNQKTNQEDKESDSDAEEDEDMEEEETPKKQSKKNSKKQQKGGKKGEEGDDEGENEEIPKYAGLKAKKGTTTLPAFKPKGKITRNSLKQKRSKKTKKLQERKQRERKVPSKRSADRPDNTEKMISKYKKKLDSSNNAGKKKNKKWFE